MGKQYNKVLKRRRRMAYLDRKKETSKATSQKPAARKAAPKKAEPAPKKSEHAPAKAEAASTPTAAPAAAVPAEA